MTMRETVLVALLSGLVAYRAGWVIGAHRMSAAIAGRPAGGLWGWYVRWRERRDQKAVVDKMADAIEQAYSQDRSVDLGEHRADGDGPSTGQYL